MTQLLKEMLVQLLISKANDRKIINEAIEKQIISKIAQRIAEKLVGAMTDDF